MTLVTNGSFVKKILMNPFNKRFISIFSFSSIGQLIQLLSYIVFARISTDEEFALFGLYLISVLVLSLVTTLRLEFVIPSILDLRELRGVVKSVLLISLFTPAFIFLFFYSLGEWLGYIYDNNIVVLLLLVLSSYLRGLNNFFSVIINRMRKFKALGISKLLQSLFFVGFVFFLHFIGFSFYILIVGYTIGLFFSLLYSFFIIQGILLKTISTVSIDVQGLTKYKDVYIYNLPSSIINGLASSIIMYLIPLYYSKGIAGMYSLSNRVLFTPISFISASLSQVVLEETSSLFRFGKSVSKVVRSTFAKLFVFGLVPFLLLGAFAPTLFVFLFGESWLEAGYYTQLMVLPVFFKFCISPLLIAYISINRIKLFSLWQLFNLFAVAGSFILFKSFFSFEGTLFAVGLVEVIVYLIGYFVLIKSSQKKCTI